MASYQEKIAYAALSQQTLDDLADRFEQYEQGYYNEWKRDGGHADKGKEIHDCLTAMLALKQDLLRNITEGKVAAKKREAEQYIQDQVQSKH